jgi:16S rRNA (cytosine1402-N4)-methyltransferase
LLASAEGLLAPGGRLAVVSFHSLEDRIVKQFFKDASGQAKATSRYMPVAEAAAPAVYTDFSKAIRAGEAELTRNPRARSATLRFAVRTAVPARHGRPA